jgi:hypothetical protein
MLGGMETTLLLTEEQIGKLIDALYRGSEEPPTLEEVNRFLAYCEYRTKEFAFISGAIKGRFVARSDGEGWTFEEP